MRVREWWYESKRMMVWEEESDGNDDNGDDDDNDDYNDDDDHIGKGNDFVYDDVNWEIRNGSYVFAYNLYVCV